MSDAREAPLRIPVDELNENDVLLGRGIGPSHYIGTQRLRALAVSRKEEYNSVDSYKIKKRIGAEIYDEITARGGRFLIQVSSSDEGATARNGARVNVFYEEVPRKKGEDKIKQLLREKEPAKKKQEKANANSSETNAQQATEDPDDRVAGIPLPHVALSETSPTLMSAGHDGIGFEGIAFPEIAPSAQGEEPLPPVSPSLAPLLPPSMFENQSPTDAYVGLFPLDQQSPSIASSNEVLRVRAHSLADSDDEVDADAHALNDGGDDKEDDADAHALDDDVSALFLAALGVGPDEPRFSQQDEIQEKAALTEEERRSILVDKFGEKCSITEHRSKRQNKDSDDTSVAFLLRQMRATIDMIPPNEKGALLIALEKARPDEFSDSRLGQFLLCEGMNPELAARRFIRYWKSRRDLFGENKFTKRMILSEAFCDDIMSIQAGVFTLLPRRDLSGRHMVFVQGTRLSITEYEAESMVRAYWYLMEIIVQEGGASFIVLDWLKNASLFDYDRNVFHPVVYLATNVWPVGPPTGHTCCPPKILVWLFKPIAFALLGKEARNRNNMHDVPPEQVAGILSSFGITTEMLPTQMGGSLELNPTEWIEKRRAIEMEEIE